MEIDAVSPAIVDAAFGGPTILLDFPKKPAVDHHPRATRAVLLEVDEAALAWDTQVPVTPVPIPGKTPLV